MGEQQPLQDPSRATAIDPSDVGRQVAEHIAAFDAFKAANPPSDLEIQRERERIAAGERAWGLPPGAGPAFNGLLEGMSTMDDASDR